MVLNFMYDFVAVIHRAIDGFVRTFSVRLPWIVKGADLFSF